MILEYMLFITYLVHHCSNTFSLVIPLTSDSISRIFINKLQIGRDLIHYHIPANRTYNLSNVQNVSKVSELLYHLLG